MQNGKWKSSWGSGNERNRLEIKSLAKKRTDEGTGNRIFQDQFKRQKDPKTEKLYKDIELDEDVLKNRDDDTRITTGKEMRSKRDRDKEVGK